MKCQNKGCDGEISTVENTVVQTGCYSSSMVFPCEKCRRLHFSNGSAVSNRRDQPAFLIDGEIVLGESKIEVDKE